MKSIIKLISLFFLLNICFSVHANCDYESGQVLVKMKANKSKAQKTSLKNEMQAVSLKTFPQLGIELWDVSANSKNGSINHIISQYKNHPDIEYIEPNYLYELPDFEHEISVKKNAQKSLQNSTLANDPLFQDQWHLDNYGQLGGISDVDINAPEAWSILTESLAVQVAILDSGIDWTHEDLVNNIWQNLGEDADGDGQVLVYQNGKWIFDPDDENGIDDDKNGYVDDFIGWDFRNNDNNPYDEFGHGTHVGGIIGAEGNNRIGIAGVSWNVPLVALKIINNKKDADCASIIEAIEYVTLMNIPISNNSWKLHCETKSISMHSAIEDAQTNGHLFIAAAGNGGFDKIGDDNDGDKAIYPASYTLENIVSVTSINDNGALSHFANYGKNSVDIAAPGENILSTYPGQEYIELEGTSMAAPQVTAACALLKQLYPNYTYSQIKNRLINTATNSNQLTGKCVSNGRLNVHAMLSESIPNNLCIRVNDSIALVKFYEATHGDNWSNSWNLHQPMNSWNGVTLNASGCVSNISLISNNLSGVIPPSIDALDYLVNLNLSNNDLFGNLPPEIGSLDRLVHLNLSNNSLVGYLPDELENLNQLQTLRLSNNQFIGSLPVELTTLNNLATLNLSNNNLQGCYTFNLKNNNWCSRFNSNSISNGNNFNTSWENFCNNDEGICNNKGPCRSTDSIALRSLYNATNGASWNKTWNLNQPISNWYGVSLNNNGCVERLKLGNNNLSSSIPSSIGNLSNLLELELYANPLSGNIPSQIGSLTYLDKLVISSTQIGGSVPTSIGNLKNLRELFLISNNLSGSIPSAIGNLVNIQKMDLLNNAFTGSIPPEIGGLIHCTYLSLALNQLSGNIPAEIGKLTKLKDLLLYDNQLSGSIPVGFGNQESLVNLSLNNNNLSGTIPAELGKLVNINNLSLNDNNLTGGIPKELAYLPDFGYISVCNNQLSGCYDATLLNLCDLIDECVSTGNNFPISWSTFCNGGAGACDWVWPGDFNADGVANDEDALYWGLAYDFKGAPRDNASPTWTGQHAPFEWTNSVKGINSKHQDGDGNGIVNDADLLVLTDNISETSQNNNSILSLTAKTSTRFELVDGNDYEYIYDVYLDDEKGNPAIVHGCSFSIQYDDLAFIDITTRNSSLNPSHVFKAFANKTHYFALTRTDKNDQECTDPVARVSIAVKYDLPTGDPKKLNVIGSTIDADANFGKQSLSVFDLNNSGTLGTGFQIGASVVHTTCSQFGSAEVKVYGNTGPYTYYWNTGETTPQIHELTSGTYKVRVTNRFGETDSLTLEVDGQILPEYDANGTLINCTTNTCPTLFSPINNVPNGTYQAGRTLKSNDYIGTGKQVVFKAQNSILLDSGFEVHPNVSHFSAKIENCE